MCLSTLFSISILAMSFFYDFFFLILCIYQVSPITFQKFIVKTETTGEYLNGKIIAIHKNIDHPNGLIKY